MEKNYGLQLDALCPMQVNSDSIPEALATRCEQINMSRS